MRNICPTPLLAGLPAKLCNVELSVFNLTSLRVHGKQKIPPPRRWAIIKRLFTVFVAPCPQVKSNSRSFLSFSVFKTKGEEVTLSRQRHCVEFVLNDESKRLYSSQHITCKTNVQETPISSQTLLTDKQVAWRRRLLLYVLPYDKLTNCNWTERCLFCVVI